MIKIAILGRPNVGKSTLFNRLAGRKLALVDDQPGVTRDRRETKASLGDFVFTLIDTAGFHYDADREMITHIQYQIDRAIELADVLLFMYDARAGITPEDETIGDILRRTNKPLILLANKCESDAHAQSLYEGYQLGLGEPVPISAEHGGGMDLLYDALKPYMTPDETEESNDEEKALQFVILGRPNAGKSTLVNQYLKEKRVVTGKAPGITRDAITIDWQYKGHPVKLIDTAGMRKRARVTEKVERLSVADGLRALQYAHVAILLMDATIALEKQDLTIGRRIVEEGRILVIGLNKWDLISKENRKTYLDDLEYKLSHVLPQVKGVPLVPISAEKGQNVYKLLDEALKLYALWNKRISTARLNQWLQEAEATHPPPLVGRNRIRLKYMTQIKNRPPTFVLFISKPLDLPDSYKRYLENSLREAFKLPAIPIRLQIRGGKNPYV